MKYKRSFLHGPHDLRMAEVELEPLKPNQVLVQTTACGVCGSDIECYEGNSAEGRYDIAPYTPGHEWCGKVVEVGSEARARFSVDDVVTGDCVMADGICANCKDGKMPSACLNMREQGFRPDSPGAWAEYFAVEEQYVHKVPHEWPYEKGAWVETFSIGYFGIWGSGGHIDASDIAIVLGIGPVGISAVMVAAMSGAKTIAIDPVASRRKKALAYGADLALNPSDGNLVRQIMDHTDGHGGDVCVEASGSDQALASLFDISAHGARVRLIGHSIGRKVAVEIGKTIWKTLNITGSGGTKDFGQRTIRFMDRMDSRYDFIALNSHTYEFSHLQEAIDTAVGDKEAAFKVMITFPS